MGRVREFWLNGGHPLSTGLVFAGLGRHTGSTYYHDSSLYCNHGTLTAMDPSTDWVWVPELNRYALDFDGSDDYVSVPTFIQPTSAISLSVWVRASKTPDNHDAVVGNTTATWSNGSWALRYNATGAQLEFWVEAYNLNFAFKTYADQTLWHHVVGTWDGTIIRIWIDGVEGTPDAYNGAMTSNAALQIGSTVGGAPRNFPGTIADPIIHNRAISLADIAILGNRADPTLGGWIMPVRRRVFPAAVVAAGNPWYAYAQM